MFADIRGFTAWCSTREPAQVFLLLESVYHSFDEIAKRRRIFKVETVGDCYVAVCGLPEPRKDHAVAMARFARDCLNKFNQMVSKLEVSLGPDTGDLKVRIGLHSGAVTGGVIRGENARFQLFGDTVNVAARMESTGVPSRIQISKDTAELLVAADKSHWCKPRDDTVNVKGKGEMTTYFLVSGEDENKSTTGSSSDGEAEGAPELSNQGNMTDKEAVEVLKLASQKTMRLVSWNVDLLKGILKQIVARRQASKTFVASSIDGQIRILDKVEENVPDIMTKPIQEVQECIHLPEFDAKIERDAARAVELDASVTEQLYDYVR